MKNEEKQNVESIKLAYEIELADGTFKAIHLTSFKEREDARAKKLLDDLNSFLKGKNYND